MRGSIKETEHSCLRYVYVCNISPIKTLLLLLLLLTYVSSLVCCTFFLHVLENLSNMTSNFYFISEIKNRLVI